MNPKIRIRGLVLFVLGLGFCCALVAIHPHVSDRIIAIICAVPGGFGLAGLLELISGHPFYQVAQKWDSMNGLVRFGLGLVIIVTFIVIFWWAAMTFHLFG